MADVTLTATAHARRRPWSIPSPEQSAPRWHVAPLVDIVVYHFSWLWILVPLLTVGSRHPSDYLVMYLVVMTINFTHRHFSLPYVYLDGQVFATHRVRFWIVPVLTIGLLLASPPLWRVPTGRAVLGALAFVAALWNVWHVYMQKYGILRLYNAKAMSADSRGVPGWVDRMLIFGWMPLYFVWLGPSHRAQLVQHARAVNDYLLPMVDALARAQRWLLWPTIGFLLVSIAVFLRHEHRTFGLRNAPRLSMALGMTLLSAAFLLFNPVKVYMAFAFSHGLEYMTFVWAFQRRRYARTLAHRPVLGRLVHHPLLLYGGFFALVGGAYLIFRFWGQYLFLGHPPIMLGGTSVARWVFYWGVYQSMMHFYYDGFLWRMRLPQVRATI